MSRIRVRQASYKDLGEYRSLQTQRWRDGNQASYKQLKIRLDAYPQGMLVAEENGKIVGMVYATRITDYDYDKCPTWYEITNNGACDKPDLGGKVIFGVDLTTAKGVGGRAGDRLLVGVGRLCIRENVEWCMLGGRMPGYHKYKDKMTAEKYLRAKNDKGEFLDKQVRYYTSVPGLRAVKTLPNYFRDPESCDYGVLLRWHNPLYNWPFPRFLSLIFPLLFKLEEMYLLVIKKLRRS